MNAFGTEIFDIKSKKDPLTLLILLLVDMLLFLLKFTSIIDLNSFFVKFVYFVTPNLKDLFENCLKLLICFMLFNHVLNYLDSIESELNDKSFKNLERL
jgi:hypothetical protein